MWTFKWQEQKPEQKYTFKFHFVFGVAVITFLHKGSSAMFAIDLFLLDEKKSFQ